MSSDPNAPETTPSTLDDVPNYVPPRPPPRRNLPIKKIAIGGLVGFGVATATYFLANRPFARNVGPQYTCGNITWQSIEPTWSTMWGEHALEMTLNPLAIRGKSEGSLKISGAILRSLCGSVLTKLPDPPDGVTRKDIYRLGFRFFEAEDKGLTDVFPIPVQDGACVAWDNQVVFDWGYPAPLTGWAPVRYESTQDGSLTVFFGRRGDAKVPYDQLDLKLACEALYTESTADMNELLAAASELEIRAVKGIVSPVLWAGVYQTQRFQIVNGTCLTPGEITDG